MIQVTTKLEQFKYFNVTDGKEELREPIGKFSLEEDVEEDDGIKCFKWSNLKEIRLLFP